MLQAVEDGTYTYTAPLDNTEKFLGACVVEMREREYN